MPPTTEPLPSSGRELGWAEMWRFVRPLLWPANEPALRLRVVLALVCLMAAKIVSIAVPFLLKAVVDAVSRPSLAAVPVAVLIAYGAARFTSAAFGELRTAIFARVGERAGRIMALRVYDHLFQLSLGYHLQRRTGELSRAIERGVKAISFLLQTGLFNLGPTLVEFLLVIGVLLWRYPPTFALITFLTVAGYAAFTVLTTDWRTKYRREMNRLDNEFAAQSVDGLINYEVVKAFGNEAYESRRLDRALGAYEDAAVKSQTTPLASSTPDRPGSSRSGWPSSCWTLPATSSPASSPWATSSWSTPSSCSSTSRSISWASSIARSASR